MYILIGNSRNFKFNSLVKSFFGPVLMAFICCVLSCKTTPTTKFPKAVESTAEVMNRVAQQMMDDLDLKIGLKGKKIQLSENNFWQFDTEINLPFSAVLRDHITAALSDRGAIVTLQNEGVERWRLTGKYGKEGNELVITIGAVKTAISASGNFSKMVVASVCGKVPFNLLERKWFKPEFPRIARTILRILDRNYSGADDLPITICPLKPGQHGQPPLRLGQEFQKFLETAVTDSPPFVFSPDGNANFGARMAGTYTIVADQMQLHIKVMDSKNRTLTSADYSVDINEIPADLLKPVADSDIDVCVTYVSESGSGLSATSPVADSLLAYVMDSLAEYNLKARRCGSGNDGDIHIETRVNLQERSTPDGFRVATLLLQLRALRSDKKVMGTVTRNERTIFGSDLDHALEKILKKIFTEKSIGEELAVMILGR